MSTDTTDLPAFPLTRQCPYQPADEYREVSSEAPVSKVRLHDGSEAWFVTGYAQSRALLADQRISSDRSNPKFPSFFPGVSNLRRAQAIGPAVLIGTDDPDHARQRKMVIPSFAVRRIAGLKPGIQRIVDARLDAIQEQGGPLDLVSSYALPIPSTVICELLGVPYEDHEFFEEKSRRRLDPETGMEALQDLRKYLDNLIKAKKANPGDGLLDDLIAEQALEGRLDYEELVTFALILLIAGHDTTANVISLGTLALLQNPEQLAALKAEPELIPAAVEELLRYVSLISALPRVAKADIEIGGQTIRAGDPVMIALASANFSSDFVDRPDDLDLHRASRHHVAFGYGIHQCLGQNLARAELEIAFASLLNRFPELRLAKPVEELTSRPGFIAGVAELPVSW
jgi:pentalenic acid synthase